MALRPWPARAKDLARVPLVLAPGGRGQSALLHGAALVAALLVGAAGGRLYGSEQPAQRGPDTVPMHDLRRAEQALAQARLQLQLSEAHGRELERQIDELNQRLRACLEEVTFFRKGHNVKR